MSSITLILIAMNAITDLDDSCKYQEFECMFLKTSPKERSIMYFKINKDNLVSVPLISGYKSLSIREAY